MAIEIYPELTRTIGLEADRLGIDAYIVGGVVRDFFLQRPCSDIDIVCVNSGQWSENSGQWSVVSGQLADAEKNSLNTEHCSPNTVPPPTIGIELAHAASRALGGSKVSVFKNFGTASFKVRAEVGGRRAEEPPTSALLPPTSNLQPPTSDLELEFVGARRESYSHDSRKPIVENGTLEDDQRRRDFTVNALAVCINADRYGELVDPFGGIRDLDAGILRTPLDPDITFSDDPLRMMRAVRFASQLGFRIADDTFEAIARNAHRLEIVSAERITAELNKIMLSPTPSLGLKLMHKCGLMAMVLPEIEALAGVETVDGRGHKDIFYHTMQVLDNVSPLTTDHCPLTTDHCPLTTDHCPLTTDHCPLTTDHCPLTTDKVLWLRWAALLHDIGKPGVKRYDARQGWTFHGHEARGARMVKKIFRRLRLPLGPEMKYVEKLVMLHMRPIVLSEDEVTDSAVRRLLFEAGDDIDDLMTLCNADITSKNPDKVRRHRANFELVKRKLVELEERDRIRNFQPPVSGLDIMQTFGIGPCHEIGIIKDAIKDAILDGQIPNDRDAAWQMMLRLAKDLGLEPASPDKR